MHDVELLMCTRLDPRLPPLLHRITDWALPREQRYPLLPELRTILVEELAGTAARWTPHYDLALSTFSEAGDYELVEPADLEFDEPDDTPPRLWQRVATGFRHLHVHRYLCEQFEAAQARGARTLADAYACATIEPQHLNVWFRLHPAPAVLTERLHAAARAFLGVTPEDTMTTEQHRTAIAATRVEKPAQYEFWNLPAGILELLGNPFDPRG